VVGAETLGILGMVLAVPIAGIVRIAMDRIAAANERAPLPTSQSQSRTGSDTAGHG
jgi:predicted PurR-regulated permease PerM